MNESAEYTYEPDKRAGTTSVSQEGMTPVKFDLKRNMLGESASPYLRQHQDNPVHWQEWSQDLLAEARRLNRPLFISVGYATCHWCHVMSAKAFSDPDTAGLLNAGFICVKIDRELRPDIDRYLMAYLVERSGQGGWPLNAFMTPALSPIYAFTYAESGALANIAQQVQTFLAGQADALSVFEPQADEPAPTAEAGLIASLLNWSDPQDGGFGRNAKFPPHTALLFLLYHQAALPNEAAQAFCQQTLDAMQLRGLHDHLQGGVFRYCVDRRWTIPHFEKMLYDQAMVLWTYALAAAVLGCDNYRVMALDTVRCLDESFAAEPARPGAMFGDTLYVTAHDVDTDHREGAVYLWSWDELRRVLTPVEFDRFAAAYEISPEGNFEGRNHLLRRSNTLCEKRSDMAATDESGNATSGGRFNSGKSACPDESALAAIEAKLLELRRQRPQPQCDDKQLCDLNALTAAALVQAGRLLDRPDLEQRAVRLVRRLLVEFCRGYEVRHALAGGQLQNECYLSDAAALLLAVTMLAESDPSWLAEAAALEPIVRAFHCDGVWMEAQASDFRPIAASWFDHPIPSSVSLAEMALARSVWLQGGEAEALDFRAPYQADFYNVAVMLTQGRFHQITRPQPLPWSALPPNAIQRHGEPATDCYAGVCTPIA